jgi:iron complex transport system substrate-binding protein
VRIASLLPSATGIITRLGPAESLVGRSNECTYPPEVQHLPVVTAARIDPSELESLEIDRQVREAIKDGRSLYAVDAELIERLAPDVIVTQDLCAVCAVSSGELGSACPVGATVISLDPSTLDEVAASIETLAQALGMASTCGR